MEYEAAAYILCVVIDSKLFIFETYFETISHSPIHENDIQACISRKIKIVGPKNIIFKFYC
jgi:hypothetical protein